ncbi:MAG: disulfide bond formation protein B [Methylophaga sp.]|nr:disulfide bond formation protein B [Methylophaga sp.]
MSSTHNKLYLLGFLFSLALFGGALYMQYVMQLEPCPLCVLQRMAVMLAGGLFLLAFLLNPKRTGSILFSSLISLVVIAGGAVSARHIWLQNLPLKDVPSCGPGFNFIIGNFPLGDAFSMIFSGSGECAEVSWQFLGLTIPAWTLIAFLVMLWLAWQAATTATKQQRRLF